MARRKGIHVMARGAFGHYVTEVGNGEIDTAGWTKACTWPLAPLGGTSRAGRSVSLILIVCA